MKLAIPLPKIVLTKINDVDVAVSNTVFNALSSIKINGEVRDETGNTLLNNYNGEIAVQIYDKDLQRFALNNDGNSAGFQFTTLGNVIFRGNATVVNGKFELTFINFELSSGLTPTTGCVVPNSIICCFRCDEYNDKNAGVFKLK
jgi:hypothetical protein